MRRVACYKFTDVSEVLTATSQMTVVTRARECYFREVFFAFTADAFGTEMTLFQSVAGIMHLYQECGSQLVEDRIVTYST
jgi:hypothetical protein